MKENMYTREQVIEKSTEYFNGDILAATVFADKYSLRDVDDNYLELTPDDMHRRLAKEFARIEEKYPNPLSEEEIFDSIKGFQHIVPQGSPMAGVGNDVQIMSVSNCFVIGSPEDSYGGIMKADEEIAQLAKRRAGIGLDISNIRPKGMKTKNAANTTDGISVFMDRFSNTCREVAQAGRRGAELQSISVHHPEVETFINIKKDKTRVTGANISVKLSEEFMVAVKNNTEYEQRWPVDSKNPSISKKVNAKKIWDMIINSAWESAEPGVLFWDNVKKNTPSEAYPDCEAVSTNPCFSIDQRVLTKDGYVKFSDLLNEPTKEIIVDNRIVFNGTSEKESWYIDNSQDGVRVVNGYNFRMTSPNEKLYKLTFKNGQELKVTADHHIATVDGMVMAKDLTQDDKILVSNCENDVSIENSTPETVDEICSFIMGLVAGDGTYRVTNSSQTICIDIWGDDRFRLSNIIQNYIDRLYELEYNSVEHLLTNGWKSRMLNKFNVLDIPKENKIRITSRFLSLLLQCRYGFTKETKLLVPEFIINNSRKKEALYYCAGLFYADASVQGSKNSGYSVRLHQSNKKMLQDVQLILHSNGISSSIYKRRDSHFKEIKGRTYSIKPQYELITSNCSYVQFKKIGFFKHPEKTNKLNELPQDKRSPNKNYTSLVSYEYVGEEPVYCLSEDSSRSCIVNTISTRRCGEIVLPKYDSCRLISTNALSFVDNPYTEKATYNFVKFKKYVKIAQKLMDDLVDIELEHIDKILAKIESDPEPDEVKFTEINLWKKIKQTCANGRRTGLGITALGDTIAALNIRYGSQESIKLVEEIYKTLAIGAYESSVDMARDRGSFLLFDINTEFNNNFIKRIYDEFDETYKEMYSKYGRRNIALTTTPPAGSISILTQTSSGIEPVFKISYIRRKKIVNNNKESDFTDSLGDKWEEFKVYHHQFNVWSKITGKTSEEESPWYKATSEDVDWESSVDLQAAAQKWVCHSISKTCNLPNSATKELVANVYMRAWESGCKGFTVYRDGCRDGVLVSSTKQNNQEVFAQHNSPKRPSILECDIHNAKIKGEQWTIMVGLLEGKPFEVFGGKSKYVSIPKKVKHGHLIKNPKRSGQDKSVYDLKFGDADDPTIIKDIAQVFENPTEGEFTRLVSLALRHGTPVVYAVEQMQKEEQSDMYSFSKVLARVLKSYITEGTTSTQKCPSCGAKIIFTEGCKKCSDNCGWSACS